MRSDPAVRGPLRRPPGPPGGQGAAPLGEPRIGRALPPASRGYGIWRVPSPRDARKARAKPQDPSPRSPPAPASLTLPGRPAVPTGGPFVPRTAPPPQGRRTIPPRAPHLRSRNVSRILAAPRTRKPHPFSRVACRHRPGRRTWPHPLRHLLLIRDPPPPKRGRAFVQPP